MSMLTEGKKKAMSISREQKMRHFYSLCHEGQTVLDVGVSSEKKDGLPARNTFLKNYRYAPETYTGLGIQDLSGMEDRFPGKRFVSYQGGRFPFADKTFDWVFSNAVVEHVGDEAAQLQFVNEMMRVAHNVFFTTPNKYFPIESHTNALLLHWYEPLFYRWRKRRMPNITRYSLYLLSGGRLKSLMKRSSAKAYQLHKNRFMGVPMTFTVVCTDQPANSPVATTGYSPRSTVTSK